MFVGLFPGLVVWREASELTGVNAVFPLKRDKKEGIGGLLLGVEFAVFCWLASVGFDALAV